MAKCRFEERALRAHDREYLQCLGKGKADRLLRHIKSCDVCKKAYKDGAKIARILANSMPTVETPYGLIERIKQRIEEI